jgi:hypothetical protein
MSLGLSNPYHLLLPDVPWDRLAHERNVHLGLPSAASTGE